ncbi:hypothetical protein WA026_005601 [Henosepilachna vigintioctopunctata]|uniref:Major facilitator superfamily (MFS) profile domain-containing protein n=1 Tax=Henosepilachna vigintioctopunctata TaxID=420089 RepID=A0AAW1TWW2_9CUCU
MKPAFLDMFEGSSPQLLAVVTGTINAVSDGMQYGWTAPTIPLLLRNDTPVAITHTDEVWLESIYMLGGVVALPFTIYLINAIGRKMMMWLSSIVGICGWICIAAGTNVYYLYVGRVLLGMTGDIAFTASPVYISEIAHQKIRGFLAGIIYLMMLIGIIVVYAIGPWVPIYATAAVGVGSSISTTHTISIYAGISLLSHLCK